MPLERAVKGMKMPAAKSKTKAAAKPKAAKTAKPAKSNVVKFKIPRPTTSLMSSFSGSGNTAKLPARLQHVIDAREIEETIAHYGRAVDRGDETLLRSLFHPDATLDYGPGVFQGAVADFMQWMSTTVANQVKTTHHMLARSRITVKGDVAFAETYFTAQHRLEKSTGREDLFIAGRYLDRLERRPGGPAGIWKFIHRKAVLDWSRTEPVADIFYHRNPDALWGVKSKQDLSYHLEQFPGTGGGKMPSYAGRRYEGKAVIF